MAIYGRFNAIYCVLGNVWRLDRIRLQSKKGSSLYLFDLVKSVDLGILEYSGMKIHCCFNIYHRPKNSKLNKKPKLSSDLFVIYRDDKQGYDKIDYDLCIFRRGREMAGVISDIEGIRSDNSTM